MKKVARVVYLDDTDTLIVADEGRDMRHIGKVFVCKNYLAGNRDGAPVGMFEPGESVGGTKNTGWVDILTGITAHRRKDGQYLVFVEEDYRAKVLMYRWRP